MKEKRVGRNKPGNKAVGKNCQNILDAGELVIQRLSEEVTGKVQKYARMGARQFVPYNYGELTIENIKEACISHFGRNFQLGKNMACDVLAGDQGPSCVSMSQIPDLRVIHVRFIKAAGSSTTLTVRDHDGLIKSRESQTRRSALDSSTLPGNDSNQFIRKRAFSEASPAAAQNKDFKKPKAPSSEGSPSKTYPKSLSLSEMLRLGKCQTSETTIVSVFKFDMDTMSWSKVPERVEFLIDKEVLGQGGFRKAYKATSPSTDYRHKTWVIKKFLEQTVQGIQLLGQEVEQHARKVVQMHLLAKNFAEQLQQKITKEDVQEEFGDTLEFKTIFFGKLETGECITIEEFVNGIFKKYINNNGLSCVAGDDVIGKKAQCLAHFSYLKSNKSLMVLDIQGCGHTLYDPEIASASLRQPGYDEYLFCAGNLSDTAINAFLADHKCDSNVYCRLLGLDKSS